MTDALKTSLRVARLPYVNVLPFFMDDALETVLTASPRQLGYEALTGRIDAGPLSLVDAWHAREEFEPVGPFGIAVRGPARSVLLFSRKPMEDLDGATIGITDQTSTSVKLLSVLLDHHCGVKAFFREGFAAGDHARLVIGDAALVPDKTLKDEFPLVFDLGREWYLWRERPFIFARWMVRKTAPIFQKEELLEKLDASLKRFEKNPDLAAHKAAGVVNLPAAALRNYLTGFVYRLTKDEEEGEKAFQSLLFGKPRGAC